MSVLTTGWIARHTPPGAGGRYAALIGIAQDLRLARLAERGDRAPISMITDSDQLTSVS